MRYNLIFYIIVRRVHRVALLKFLKGQNSQLTTDKLIAAQAGWVFVTEDTGNMYIKTAEAGKEGQIQLNANLANALRVSSTDTSLMYVGSANKPVYFDQGKPAAISFLINAYGTCSTAGGTKAKAVTINGYTLVSGQTVYIKFTKDNTVDSPTLNISNTGAKEIYYNGAPAKSYHITANSIHELLYDGSYYHILGTDNKVMQVAGDSTMTNWRPLVIGSANNSTSTFTSFGTKIDSTYVFTNILAQPSTGTIKATKFDGTATTATKLSNTTAIGGTTQPVYFKADGIPEKISYTINKSVPANAIFTDTTYSAGTGLSLSGTTFNHSNSITAGTASGSSSKTLTYGGTFTIPTVKYDAQGHITEKGTTTMTMPAAPTNASTVTVTGTNTANQYIYLTGVTSVPSASSSDSKSLYTTADSSNSSGPRIEPNSKALYGAVWNDYAECRETKEDIKPGRVVCETGKGDLVLSTERLQAGANIVSDTFGFIIGETSKAKTPIAVSGRALAYSLEDKTSYAAGDAVCAGPNGTVSKMTREEIREYPDRILGTVSEIPDYEVWGENDIIVDGRIWIKVR